MPNFECQGPIIPHPAPFTAPATFASGRQNPIASIHNDRGSTTVSYSDIYWETWRTPSSARSKLDWFGGISCICLSAVDVICINSTSAHGDIFQLFIASLNFDGPSVTSGENKRTIGRPKVDELIH